MPAQLSIQGMTHYFGGLRAVSNFSFEVPQVSTITDTGRDTPIAYETCTWHCLAMPAATDARSGASARYRHTGARPGRRTPVAVRNGGDLVTSNTRAARAA